MRYLKATALGVLALLAGASAAEAGFYQTFDIPGAGTGRYQGTYPKAIGGGRFVAGYYMDGGNVSHGFLGIAGSGIVTFDAPGAGTDAYQGTSANGVNAAGIITGTVTGATDTKGFVRDASGNFQVFAVGTDHLN